MSHKRKQFEKSRNPVAKYNQHRGGYHGKSHKAERKHVHDELLDEVEEEMFFENENFRKISKEAEELEDREAYLDFYNDVFLMSLEEKGK